MIHTVEGFLICFIPFSSEAALDPSYLPRCICDQELCVFLPRAFFSLYRFPYDRITAKALLGKGVQLAAIFRIITKSFVYCIM